MKQWREECRAFPSARPLLLSLTFECGFAAVVDRIDLDGLFAGAGGSKLKIGMPEPGGPLPLFER
jgi:hypothetical protein